MESRMSILWTYKQFWKSRDRESQENENNTENIRTTSRHRIYNNIQMKKQYQCDKLTRLKGKIKVWKIASYDIETETETGYNNFLLGGFIDAQGKYKSFWNKEEMREYMCKHTDKDTLIYATKNSFDYNALFYGTEDFHKIEPLSRGNLLITGYWKNLELYDTKAYTKASVEQLGEMLGLPKLKINLGKNKINMTKWEKKKLVAYNKRDCEVTRLFMIKLQELLNLLGGNLKSTIGACAMDLFRRKYLEEDIQHEYQKEFRDGMTIKEFLKCAYHGGRTEMFKRGEDDQREKKEYTWKIFDVNSLYPSVMLNEFPKPSSAHLTESKIGALNISSIMKYEGVSDCEVVCPYMYYPILSTFVKDKLCFIIGRFRDVFTHIELREAIKNGYKVTKIYRTIAYTKKIRPFTKWINELYAIRLQYQKENNKIFSDLTKIIMNSLYGKFFQSKISNTEYKQLTDRNDKDLSQEGFTWDYDVGLGYKSTPKESNQKFITPIFSVYVTAYARLKIWKKIKELNAVYCDTDSAITKEYAETSDKLGEFKLEYETDYLLLGKQKHYKSINKKTGKVIRKAKGLFFRGTEEEKEEQFEQSITGRNVKQIRFLSLNEAIIHGGKPNQVIIVNKKIDMNDTKRRWLRPFNRMEMQDSRPLISGYDSVDDLMKDYDSI